MRTSIDVHSLALCPRRSPRRLYSHSEAAGAYLQSSCQGDERVPGESCEAYGEVVIYDVSVEHNGAGLAASLVRGRADTLLAFLGGAC